MADQPGGDGGGEVARLLAAALIGGVIGAALGLLLAPKAGTELVGHKGQGWGRRRESPGPRGEGEGARRGRQAEDRGTPRRGEDAARGRSRSRAKKPRPQQAGGTCAKPVSPTIERRRPSGPPLDQFRAPIAGDVKALTGPARRGWCEEMRIVVTGGAGYVGRTAVDGCPAARRPYTT